MSGQAFPFQLTILGTSSALPTSNRYPTAQVLNVLGRFFLIDCGEGTQTQMRKYKIGFSQINHILISHLHGDHFFGLIGLISTMELLGRKKDLHIFVHTSLQKFLSPQIRFLYPAGLSFPIVYHPLNPHEPEVIFEDKKLAIRSFPLVHRIATCGFRFDEKPELPGLRPDKIAEYQIPIRERQQIKEGGDFVTEEGRIIKHEELTIRKRLPRSFAFCSDSRFDESYLPYIEKVDLLYHEATFADDNQELATNTYHSTGKDAATIALRGGVGKLLIGHFSARYKSHQLILDEARAVFPNTLAIAEGDIIQIP